MENNTISFEVKDDQVTMSYKAPASITDFLQLVSTGILAALTAVVDAAEDEETKEQIREDLYDMYNAAASNTLHYFAPNIDMRPHLTAQAILEAEDAIIAREANKYAKAAKATQSKGKANLKALKGGKA